MNSGEWTEAQGLAGLMADRRNQMSFRLRMASVFVGGFLLIFADARILIWGGVYAALQGAEVVVFRRERIASLCQSKAHRAFAQVILALNIAVFASVPFVELRQLGLWSVAYGEAVVACTLLNVALTTHGNKTAFMASLAPGFIYLLILPTMAWAVFGCPLRIATAIAALGVGLVYGTFKLWSQTGAAHDAERKVRLELQRTAEDANENRTFLDAILEYVPAILQVQDAEDGRIVLVNRAMQMTAGRPRADLVGRTPFDIMEPDLAARTLQLNQSALKSGAPVKFGPYPIATAHGQRLLRTTKIPIIGLDRPYVLSVSEDVTEDQAIAEAKAAAAAALTQALARAEAANEAKSVFLATMSHEIRTPLNGVLGMVQAMAADDLAPIQRERLGVVRQSGRALLQILNDVLDISKIEAGQLELEAIAFGLSGVAAGCEAAFTNVAASKGLSFLFSIDSQAQGVYLGDPTRLRQILYNLLSNAMKFTDAGEVGVRIARTEDRLDISVTDTGVGMTPDQTGRLFQKFAQADASTTRKFGGTGLGLAIVRDLARAMGGDVEVQSGLGVGTTFTVRLHLPWIGPEAEVEAAEAAVDAENVQDNFETLRVLVAEDNDINRLVITTLLDQVGVSPVVVTNGELAVEAWEAQPWDVILMDVQMPVMDGPTATRLIRRRESQTGRARTPILALTANAMTHQVAEYMAAGMDGHVAKPIEAQLLFSALEQALASVETKDTAIAV
jgi:PAS domain S-box-containing protein